MIPAIAAGLARMKAKKAAGKVATSAASSIGSSFQTAGAAAAGAAVGSAASNSGGGTPTTPIWLYFLFFGVQAIDAVAFYFGARGEVARLLMYLLFTTLVAYKLFPDQNGLGTLGVLATVSAIIYIFQALILNLFINVLNLIQKIGPSNTYIDVFAYSTVSIVSAIIGIGVAFFIFAFIKNKTNITINPGILLVYLYAVFAMPLVTKVMEGTNLLEGAGPSGALIGSLIQVIIFATGPFFWFAAFTDSHPPKIVRFFTALFIFFITIVIIISNIGYLSVYNENAESLGVQNAYAGWDAIKNFGNQSWHTIITMGRNVRDGVTEDIRCAQGLCYDFEAEVERGSLRDVGLELKPVTFARTNYRQDDQIEILSRIEARTLDTDIPVEIGCYRENAREPGSFNPGRLLQTSFLVREFINYEIQCIFPPNTVMGGQTHHFNINASFQYVTSGYVRRYFTKPGYLDQIRRPGERTDSVFFRMHGISESDLRSKYTSGPVELALDIANNIIEVSQPSPTTFLLRIGLKPDTRWRGTLKQINSVLISVPDGFQIARNHEGELACTFAGLGSSDAKLIELQSNECAEVAARAGFSNVDCNNFIQYFLDINAPLAQNNHNSEIIFACNVFAVDPFAIMGDASFGASSFRARVKYTYQLSQRATIFVNQPANPNARLLDQSIANMQICGIDYSVLPVYTLLFNERANAKESANRLQQTILSRMDENTRSAFENLDCLPKHIAWALMDENFRFMGETQNQGNLYYGFLRVTAQQIASLPSSEFLDGLTREDILANPSVHLTTHGTFYGIKLLNKYYNECKAYSNPVECLVGRMVCDTNYIFDDFSGCRAQITCLQCQQNTIPRLVTIAAQYETFGN